LNADFAGNDKEGKRAADEHGYRIVARDLMPVISRNVFLLTHFERVLAIVPPGKWRGTTMADRSGLKLVGFIFATVTVAVMLTTTMVVKGYADGVYTLDAAPIESQ
jgi:hypothetical protein